jgi:hypothetical protein
MTRLADSQITRWGTPVHPKIERTYTIHPNRGLWNAAALGCGAPVFARSQQLVADFQLIFNYQITQLPNGGLSLYP